jgi:hypothetical protein
MSTADYYAMPVEELKTYPVYMPGREPAGYWEGIQKAGPQPLIEPRTLRTEADWIRAGERVFFDAVALRTFDPKVTAMARDRAAMEALRAGPYPDGTISALRWVPTGRRRVGQLQRLPPPAPPDNTRRWRLVLRSQHEQRPGGCAPPSVCSQAGPFVMGGNWVVVAGLRRAVGEDHQPNADHDDEGVRGTLVRTFAAAVAAGTATSRQGPDLIISGPQVHRSHGTHHRDITT